MTDPTREIDVRTHGGVVMTQCETDWQGIIDRTDELIAKINNLIGRVEENGHSLRVNAKDLDEIKRKWDALPPYTPGEYTVDGKTCNFPLEDK